MGAAIEVAVLVEVVPVAQVEEEEEVEGISALPGSALSTLCIMWDPPRAPLPISPGETECPSCRADRAVVAREARSKGCRGQ